MSLLTEKPLHICAFIYLLITWEKQLVETTFTFIEIEKAALTFCRSQQLPKLVGRSTCPDLPKYLAVARCRQYTSEASHRQIQRAIDNSLQWKCNEVPNEAIFDRTFLTYMFKHRFQYSLTVTSLIFFACSTSVLRRKIHRRLKILTGSN